MTTRLRLPHGLQAELIDADEDRPPVVVLTSSPPRRWAKNSHLWETCACPECAQRRAGLIGSGY